MERFSAGTVGVVDMIPALVIYITIGIVAFMAGWFGAWICGAWQSGSVGE